MFSVKINIQTRKIKPKTMAKKCLICRNSTPFLFWASGAGGAYYDTDTEEKYCICSKCFHNLRKSGVSIDFFPINKGIRKTVIDWYDCGAISPIDLERIETDSIKTIAQKYLNTSSPTFGIWIQDRYIIVDEISKRMLIERHIVNLSDIENYKIYDNSIEYNVQSPNSTQYDLNTHHGLRRTIVGGIMAGPAGAAMGGLTANHSLTINEGKKSTYSTTEHDFTILIILKSLAYGGSLEVKVGNSDVKLQALINMFDKIINR